MSKDLRTNDLIELGYDGGLKTDFYSQHPCRIGYTYFRVTVTGDVLPCCIASDYVTGHLENGGWKHGVWFTLAQANFREKMLNINKELFHRTDSRWSFCKQCSHLSANEASQQQIEKIDQLLNAKVDDS